MAPNEKDPAASAQLAKAIARWEGEGGALSTGSQAEADPLRLASEDLRILEALGAAVLANWNDLGTEIRKRLFEAAVASGEAVHRGVVKEQIARFLHEHKDDRG